MLDYGDSGVLVEFAESFSEEAWVKAHSLASQVRECGIKGVTGVIPTYASVLFCLDPLITDPETVEFEIKKLFGTLDRYEKIQGERRCFKIPVLYGGEWGPDLSVVATELGISEEEVIDQHISKRYPIRCIGSPVGEPLMSAPQFPGNVPRRETPRTKIPPGSVAVAGKQTTIYTLESPGGWQLIGQSPIQFVDMFRNPPVPYHPGDYFEFFRIEEKEWQDYSRMRIDEMLVIV